MIMGFHGSSCLCQSFILEIVNKFRRSWLLMANKDALMRSQWHVPLLQRAELTHWQSVRSRQILLCERRWLWEETWTQNELQKCSKNFFLAKANGISTNEQEKLWRGFLQPCVGATTYSLVLKYATMIGNYHLRRKASKICRKLCCC